MGDSPVLLYAIATALAVVLVLLVVAALDRSDGSCRAMAGGLILPLCPGRGP